MIETTFENLAKNIVFVKSSHSHVAFYFLQGRLISSCVECTLIVKKISFQT